jgi:hypothetical protein
MDKKNFTSSVQVVSVRENQFPFAMLAAGIREFMERKMVNGILNAFNALFGIQALKLHRIYIIYEYIFKKLIILNKNVKLLKLCI